MFLYKYCDPAGGLAILKSRSIHLVHPRIFNDPFALKPHYATTVYLGIQGRSYAFPDMKVGDLKTDSTVVLSLSENPRSQLMWAHYAQAHTGLAIGFERTTDILNDSSPHRLLKRVTYARQRPSKPTADDFTDDEVRATKSVEWQHEREWRILDSAFSGDSEPIDPPGNDRVLFAVRPDKVRVVVLGCRADSELRESIAGVLQQAQYRHVRMSRCEVDDRKYRLNIKAIRT